MPEREPIDVASAAHGAPGPESRRLSQLARPLWYALGSMVVLCCLYEVAERTWLVHVDMDLLHVLHKLGGVFLAFVVAIVASWTILRSSPAFLAISPAGDEWLRQPRLSEADRIRIYAQWFIAMRWIALLIAGLLVVVTVKVLEWLPPEVWRPLLLTVAVLGAFNLTYAVLLRHNRGVATLLLAQGYVDLAILTALLQFSGGVENPLSTVMIFHVIIAGVLLSRRQCYGIAAAGSLLFGLMIWAEWAQVWRHYTLELFPHVSEHGQVLHEAHQSLYVWSRGVLQAVILFLTGYFVTSLAERMRYHERRLEAMADRALAERQLLERALETTGTGLRVLNRDWQTRWCSSQWHDWFGAPGGSHCADRERPNGHDCPAHQTLQDGQVRMTEVVAGSDHPCAAALRPAGPQRVFQITTAPLLDGAGSVSQVVELAQDITQQKQTQAQMVRAGKLAAVGELAGQVAHEVNNPIAIISAKTNLLLADHRSEMSPKIATELGKISHLAGRVARIAQGLLSYCRPSGAARVRLDVRIPIRKSLGMIEEQARRIGVQIQDHLPEALPPVLANPNEMEQVFLNLFLNALDAMPSGGRLTLTAAARPAETEDPGSLAIQVADTGPGIPEELRERVLEPFFTTKQEGRGTGLGLPICLGLLRSHGGQLDLDSQTGHHHGTCVTVRLPAASNPVAPLAA